jgi:hypothetical protein
MMRGEGNSRGKMSAAEEKSSVRRCMVEEVGMAQQFICDFWF